MKPGDVVRQETWFNPDETYEIEKVVGGKIVLKGDVPESLRTHSINDGTGKWIIVEKSDEV